MNESYYDYFPVLPTGSKPLMDYYGDYGHMPPPKKCTCGLDKVYGEGVIPPSQHSTWCDKYEPEAK
jgi:hypothetical protein